LRARPRAVTAYYCPLSWRQFPAACSCGPRCRAVCSAASSAASAGRGRASVELCTVSAAMLGTAALDRAAMRVRSAAILSAALGPSQGPNRRARFAAFSARSAKYHAMLVLSRSAAPRFAPGAWHRPRIDAPPAEHCRSPSPARLLPASREYCPGAMGRPRIPASATACVGPAGVPPLLRRGSNELPVMNAPAVEDEAAMATEVVCSAIGCIAPPIMPWLGR
jgi:hypothetical protein